MHGCALLCMSVSVWVSACRVITGTAYLLSQSAQRCRHAGRGLLVQFDQRVLRSGPELLGHEEGSLVHLVPGEYLLEVGNQGPVLNLQGVLAAPVAAVSFIEHIDACVYAVYECA